MDSQLVILNQLLTITEYFIDSIDIGRELFLNQNIDRGQEFIDTW